MRKIVIIDDENKARNTIENIILSGVKDVVIVEKADGVQTGLISILKHKPDIVIMDINLGNGTGFHILKELTSIDFKLIFITAYHEYAIKAFKFSALDYLLKPVDPFELIATVEKAKSELAIKDNAMKIEAFFANFENIKNEVKKIVLKTTESIHLINVQDIIRCESDNNYTKFFLKDNKKLLVSNTLKDYEEILSEYNFARVHQSHLVNLNYVTRLDKRDGFTLIMLDNSQIPVSARKRNQLLEIFDKY